MKRTHLILSIGLASLTFLMGGCKGKETASSNSASTSPGASSSVTANANSPAASTAQPATTPAASEPAQLIGTYEAREVENKGVVTLISHIKTLFSFTPDGTYSRVSQVNGKTYHSDGGLFRIEAPNKLILTIQIAGKTIQNPRIEKKLIYSLSADGDELKLTSEKGTATYQRIRKAKAS